MRFKLWELMLLALAGLMLVKGEYDGQVLPHHYTVKSGSSILVDVWTTNNERIESVARAVITTNGYTIEVDSVTNRLWTVWPRFSFK
jgi:hypothetical protein